MRVPEGWLETTVGEVCEFIGRGEAPRYAKTETGTWAVSQRCVRNGTLDLTVRRPHDPEKEVKQRAFLRDGDICVNSTGTGTLGRVALWENPSDGTYFADSHVTVARPLPCVVPKILADWLQMRPVQADLHTTCVTGSTNQIELSKTAFGQLRFLLPPLPEQRGIAEILSSVDEAIAATRAVIEQTRTVKQGVLKRLLTKGISHTRFKQTEIGEIPEAWEVLRIGEIGAVQAGRQRSPHFTEGTLRPYLRVANVFDGYIDVSDVLQMSFTDGEYERYRLAPGDILLNEGQSLELVGRNAVYEGVPTDCCFQNTLIRLRSGPRVLPRFAYALMQHLFATGQFMAIASRTTSVAHLGVKRYANLAVPVPPKDEQARIAEIHDHFSQTLRVQAEKYGELVQLKSALLSDLLSGRKRVPLTDRAAAE